MPDVCDAPDCDQPPRVEWVAPHLDPITGEYERDDFTFRCLAHPPTGSHYELSLPDDIDYGEV
jgi:hypothetical protein